MCVILKKLDTLEISFQDLAKNYTNEEKPLRSQEKVGFATDVIWNTHRICQLAQKILSGTSKVLIS